ncbi:hypothetical protein A0H81_04648 [Grifola frondosa]|uniref:Uncharacterized protein n=1 Tax=Grifola frondosa TaxID=5627 RepID=A0A1C7MFY5_GRIFR|nr:hypothetical protein A0H81_04648 [Grifola frondosa]
MTSHPQIRGRIRYSRTDRCRTPQIRVTKDGWDGAALGGEASIVVHVVEEQQLVQLTIQLGYPKDTLTCRPR